MTKEKQIDEMAKAVCVNCMSEVCASGRCAFQYDCPLNTETIKRLYNAGYRKASDVAREVLEEIEEGLDKYYDERVRITNPALFNYRIQVANAIHELRMSINALKKKYTESEDTE